MQRTLLNFYQRENINELVKFFDDAVKSLLPPEKLQETWEILLKQVGEFKREIDVRTERTSFYNIVYITCEFSLMDIDVKLVFKDKKIVGLFFQPAPPRKGYSPPSYVDLSSSRRRSFSSNYLKIVRYQKRKRLN